MVHEQGGHRTAEVTANGIVVRSAADILDMLGSVFWNDEADALAIYEKHVTTEFFDLSTGIAGEILQKCSKYRFRLALIGRFEKYPSSSLQAFILESNRGRQVVLVSTLQEALGVWGSADS